MLMIVLNCIETLIVHAAGTLNERELMPWMVGSSAYEVNRENFQNLNVDGLYHLIPISHEFCWRDLSVKSR